MWLGRRTVIRAVARWKNVVEVLQASESLERLAEMENELERLMEGLGVPRRRVASKASGKQLCKVTAAILASLAKKEEAEQFIAFYNDYFSMNDDEVELSEAEVIPITFGQSIEGADPGVEIELGMTPDDLKTQLGFKGNANGLPALFNTNRHTSGLTLWVGLKGGLPGSEMEPLTLHWHQLAGIHSILRHTFTPEPVNTPRGMLIADGVGLGKTYQAVAVMAFLMDLIAGQERSKNPPPLIEARPFLGDRKIIPNAPHLIIIPGTLLPQWISELQTLFMPKSVDILTYVSGKDARTQFWAEDGPYRKSSHPPNRRIIVATFTALQQDFEICYDQNPPPGSKLPWDKPRARGEASGTLLGLHYLTTTIDEAHLYRNHGPRQTTILVLLLLAKLRLILTATPLQTSTKDIAAMGRFVGIPFFSSPQALLEEKDDIAAVRKVREADPIDQEGPGKIQIKAAQRLQDQFEGKLLRRDGESRDWEQKVLLTLPPCESHRFVLKLTEREEPILKYHRDIAKENTSTANAEGRRLFTRKFYLEYRMAVIFALEHPDEPIPDFETLEQWWKMRGTKIDACARLCKHFLERDDAPTPTVNDGTITYPAIPPLAEGQVASRDRKILIFQEFPSMGPLLRQILKLYEVDVLHVDGSQAFEKRAAVVTKFKKSGTPCVLIISSVGATGLNLAVADVVIFLDQPWSQQDERQIIGRAHRQPQTRLTTVIHLLGDGSSDVLMSGFASSKGGMMTAFFGGDPEIAHTLAGGYIPHEADNDDISDPDPPDDDEFLTKPKPAKKPKLTGEARKQAQEEKRASKERKQAEKARAEAEKEAGKALAKAEKEARKRNKKAKQETGVPPTTTTDEVPPPVAGEKIMHSPSATSEKAAALEDDPPFPGGCARSPTEPSDGFQSDFTSEVELTGMSSGDDTGGFDAAISSGEDVMDGRGFDTEGDGNQSTHSAPASSPMRISPKVSPAAGTERRRAYELEDSPTRVRHKKSSRPSCDFQFEIPSVHRSGPSTVSPPPSLDTSGTAGTSKFDPFAASAYHPKPKLSTSTQAPIPFDDNDVFKAFASKQKAAATPASNPPRNPFQPRASTTTFAPGVVPRPEPIPRKENPFARKEGTNRPSIPITSPSGNDMAASSSRIQDVGPPPPNPLQTKDRTKRPRPSKRQGDLRM